MQNMNKKLTGLCGAFAAVGAALFTASMFLNRGYFEAIAFDSVFSYQVRQFVALAVLFLMGFVCLTGLCGRLTAAWVVLFSLPVGICLWSFSSLLLLLAGIPYTFPGTLALIAAILVTPLAVKRLREGRILPPGFWGQATPFLLLFLGLAFVAASGFIYSFVSYDSYFYFLNYGRSLPIMGSFAQIAGGNSYTLTNIGQFLPLLCAYTAFWRLDQSFQVQTLLVYDIIVTFFYGLYRYASCRRTWNRKPALLYSALFTLLLASSTSFITVSSWTLANLYCMAYIFFLFMAAFLISHLESAGGDCLILISMFFTALTLLRKDGIIFSAFFLICFCSIKLFPKRQLALSFLPAAVIESWWLYYVRVVVNATVTQGVYSAVTNNKNIVFIALIIGGTFLYIALGHDLLKAIERKYPLLMEYYVIFAGMFVLLLYSFYMKGDIIIDNVDFVIRNMFRYPSSWGISGFAFGTLLVFSLIAGFKLDYLHFFWSGYAFLTFISYCIVESKNFWLNWDDSYNRVLLQIVPVFVFVMAVKSLSLLQSDTPDHSCGSWRDGGR